MDHTKPENKEDPELLTFANPTQQLALNVARDVAQWLVHHNRVSASQADQAMDTFLGYLKAGNLRQASFLKVLCWEFQSLDEASLLEYQIHSANLGYCDLDRYQVNTDILSEFSIAECWATLSYPFDITSNYFFIATCHHLSKVNREHWQNRLKQKIIWYAADVSSLTIALEKVSDLDNPNPHKEN